MGFLDALLGRTRPSRPNLDSLFGLPFAQITLEASEGLLPTGQAGVCFKPATGQDFAATEAEVTGLLSTESGNTDAAASGGAELSHETDEFGYRWIVIGATDFETLVTRVHYVNSTLEEHGYGPQLLCSVFGFAPKAPDGTPAPANTYLIYLYKRGSFYPFIPAGAQQHHDGESELRLKNELASDINLESDLDHWFPIWTLPVH